jgi:hypothetical protein
MGRSALEDDDEVIACLLSKRELVMRGAEIAETLYAQVMPTTIMIPSRLEVRHERDSRPF